MLQQKAILNSPLLKSKLLKFNLSLLKRCIEFTILSVALPALALADFSTSLQSLVTGVFSGIFPAILMYEAGLAGIAFARKTPDAKDKAEATALGILAILGINGLWSFINGHIK